MSVHVFDYVCMYCISMYVHVWMYVCMYVCTCTYVCHIFMYIDVYTWNHVLSELAQKKQQPSQHMYIHTQNMDLYIYI